MGGTKTIFVLVIVFLQFPAICYSAPLSTNSQWIVDQRTEKRVKLACVSWASHLQTMIAEGLEKQPLDYIAKQIADSGFNCVRFTWATFMFTRSRYYDLTVSQSLDKYNLTRAKIGVAIFNPQIMKMKIREVHKLVVNALGKNNLMVVLDNHISETKWCCAGNDGNGFFGDASFDPNEWLKGLTEVARFYKDNFAVVGMSLRNELRGKGQNLTEWYAYMQQGANIVHNEAPNFLIIVSGLYYDTSLSFLRKKPLKLLNVENKLVYEVHWYAFGNIVDRYWLNHTNRVCSDRNKLAQSNYLFLTKGDKPFPIFLSEFGTDQSGKNATGNRYMTCLLAFLAENDIDWALWTFQGSYMYRQGKVNLEETYGVMNFSWNGPRNLAFLKRLQFVSQVNQDPISSNITYTMMFHPKSGECVRVDKRNNLFLDNCEIASQWDQHVDGGTIKLARSPWCLAVVKDGRAARLTKDCSSKWKFASSSGLHLASRINELSEYLCLERNTSNSKLVTTKCLCVGDNLVDLPTCAINPQVQWFKLVSKNVYV